MNNAFTNILQSEPQSVQDILKSVYLGNQAKLDKIEKFNICFCIFFERQCQKVISAGVAGR